MVSSHRIYALAAASILSLLSAASAQTLSTPTYTGALAAMTAKGCFSDPTPLEDHGSYTYQSIGNCQPICVGLDMPVMGLVNGTNCWCGSEIPSKDSQVSDDECSTPCSGYDKDTCGGANFWQVRLTGSTQNKIPYYDDSSSSSSSSSKTTAQAGEAVTSIVQEGTTIIKTIQGGAATSASSSSTSSSSSGGGGSSNTAGIAAGVVVGVVALAAIVGGTFLYLRYRRRKAVEEEYRRQAAVSDFVGGGKPPHTSHSSMTDSRLDPEVMLQRRQSDGSIADNQDYSRRILRVANPDGL